MAITKATASSVAPAAKGDFVVGSATNDAAVLSVGANNTVLTADSSTATGLKWATPAGGGKVLQVVYSSYSTNASNSTTTYADTGLSATITPTLATSKVLILLHQAGCAKQAGDSVSGLEIQLLRASTEILKPSYNAGATNTSLRNVVSMVSAACLDEPSTTSATTYKTRFRNVTNSASVDVQYQSATSTIVLMEIGV